jgi:hypothetical protein
MELDAFDLVELTEPVAGHGAGDRGRVVLAGPGHVLVDFALSDHHEPNEHDVINVSTGSLRLVERRRDQQSAWARS